MKVVLATGNPGKVEEMQRELAEFGFEVIPQSELNIGEAVEDGLSFVENAIKKARFACQHSGLPAIADDSGLEIDALDGRPGIYSARFAENQSSDISQDEANNQKLLNELNGKTNRTARYQCVLVYMTHSEDPTPIICNGSWEGSIAEHPKGSQGFGYDPLFFASEHNCHAAELEPSIKKTISHRAKALTMLKAALKEKIEL